MRAGAHARHVFTRGCIDDVGPPRFPAKPASCRGGFNHDVTTDTVAAAALCIARGPASDDAERNGASAMRCARATQTNSVRCCAQGMRRGVDGCT